jgi:hypothetical protein
MKNADAWIAAGELTLWDLETSGAREDLRNAVSRLEAAAGLAARVRACTPFADSVQTALEETRRALASLQFDAPAHTLSADHNDGTNPTTQSLENQEPTVSEPTNHEQDS